MTKCQIDPRTGVRTFAAVAVFSLLVHGWSSAQAQTAASLSQRDVQILARALGFLQPSPSRNAWIGVAFAPGDTASREDAERVVALFSNGPLRAQPVSADALDTADGYGALIAATGAPIDKVMAAARAHHVACITASLDQVEGGRCTIWIRSEPRVEIAVSHAAAQSCGLSLAAAFRMMIREL